MTAGAGAAGLSETLRRFDAVVLPVRFARRVAQAWAAVREERQRERRASQRLGARDRSIREYFDRATVHKLQIGAGTNPLEDWLNADLEPDSDPVIFLDALQRFPFDDETFDYVFSEHMIEHIPYTGGLFMLREARRVMKPGARIRIATPDARRIAGLLSEPIDETQRDYIRWSASVHLGLYSDQLSPLQQRRPEWAINPAHMRRYFPDASADCACFVVNNFFRSYGHQFLYDRRTLAAALLEAGFDRVEPVEPGRSADSHLDGIDAHARLIGEASNAFETLVLEAVRP
jgi:predicted SAM-dependent methyltransferase